MTIGRTRQRLAKLLQKSFPLNAAGVKLTWLPEHIYPATGAYRTNRLIDCYRWTAYGYHYRADGTFYAAMTVDSYETMTELVKATNLVLAPFSREVTAE